MTDESILVDDSILLSDQVFQLNTFLWALEDLPEDSDIQPVQPVLRQAGYCLRSIGQSLIMPAEESSLIALGELTGSSDPRSSCRPDLWIRHSSDSVEMLIELKAQGFSPESTNKNQALKLMAGSFNVAPSLGEYDRHPGHITYATVSKQANELANTLKRLASALKAKEVPAAPTAVIGLSIDAGELALSSPDPSDLPTPASKALAKPAIVLRSDGLNSLQPLYFIPWIPGIEDSQNDKLQSDGLSQLTARLLTHAISQIGQSQTPKKLVLEGCKLLNRATFGIFKNWRDQDRKQFSEGAAKIIERILKPVVTVKRRAGSLELDLWDDEMRESIIRRLEEADPANPAKNLEAATREHLTLFDLSRFDQN